MGFASFLVAFVPTYASIGMWGAVILTALRLVQGASVGGVWGGSTLLAMEWSRTNEHRGLIASWPQLGLPAGLLLSNLTVLGLSVWTGDQFAVWGWRVPYVSSIILAGLALWVRVGVGETPVFELLSVTNRVVRHPTFEAITKQGREIILSALLRVSEQAPSYVFTAFIFAYAITVLRMPRDFILSAVLMASCVSLVTIPLFGYISDRIGRKAMYLIGVIAIGLFGFVYFRMLDTAVSSTVFIAIVLSAMIRDMQYGPQAAFIAEAFTPSLRYSGASLGYQLGSTIGGGLAPIITTSLFTTYGTGYAVAVYIAGCALVGAAATALMPDRHGKEISAAAYDT